MRLPYWGENFAIWGACCNVQPMTDLIRSASLTGYHKLAQTVGLDAYRMLQQVGLDRCNLSDPDVRIPADAVRELLELSSQQSGVEDFGLRLSAERQLANLGPMALLVRVEPTVRTAILALERYLRLHRHIVRVTLEEADKQAILRAQMTLVGTSGIRQATELAVGIMCRTLGALFGELWTPDLVCFTHPAPAGRTIHREFFRARVLFDHELNGIALRSGDLNRTIPAADAAMARYVNQYLDNDGTYQHAEMRDMVRQLVQALLPTGRCTAELVARHLGQDRRTVNRKLALSGETFSSIVNRVRNELVRRHISAERRSLSETSELVGFSTLSAFSRWFQGEFGCSASHWRKSVEASKSGSSQVTLR